MSDRDPITRRSSGVSLAPRLLRTMRLLAAFAILAGGIAVIGIARGDSSIQMQRLIVIALGVGLAVLMGGGLMTLLFLGNRNPNDARAASLHDQEQHDPRP